MAGSSARAVIIGGGITGTLIARELCLHGFQVTLLEAAHLGAGSSSRTAAGIRQQFSTPDTVRGMRYSVRFYREFAAEVEGGQSPINQRGYLFLYGSEGTWHEALARVEMQRQAGLTEVEPLHGDDLCKRFPWVSRESVLGGTFCPTDGFLYPALIYQEAARRAKDLGAKLVQGAPVQQARHQNGRLSEVVTPKGTFGGDLFLDCTNAWTGRTGEILGAVRLPVDPLKRYLWFVARDGSMDSATLSAMPLVITPTGAYCRPENAETLLIGKAHHADSEPAFSYEDQDRVEPSFAHTTGVDAAPYVAWAELAQALPPIGEFGGITATTSGFYATTPDHNPFLDYDPQVSNLVRLVGFSGHGAMFGPFTALVGRTLALAGKSVPFAEIDGTRVHLDAFKIGRPFGSVEVMVI